MSNTTEEAFEIFVKHWKERSPAVRLDDDKIRNEIMALIGSSMVILAAAPEVWPNFYKLAEEAMVSVTPPALREAICQTTTDEHAS